MIENLNIYVVLIILLILIIFYQYISRNTIYDELINGVYQADESFCEESGIELFTIYIDEDGIGGSERSGYILASTADSILINEPVIIKLSRNWNFGDMDEIIYDTEFIGLSDEVTEFFPNIQSIKFYPKIGKIILHYDNTVTAVLYKHAINTELKYIMEDIEDDASISDEK
jgi:hypothetical protein